VHAEAAGSAAAGRHAGGDRAHWLIKASCASPQTEIEGQRGVVLALVVGYLEGRRHLPVVALREAA
jgi:hypothetical protein